MTRTADDVIAEVRNVAKPLPDPDAVLLLQALDAANAEDGDAHPR